MEYKHYTFSNEAKPNLLEFYKAIKNKKQDNPTSNTWRLFLPKNDQLITELNDMQLITVIDLSDDEKSTKNQELELINGVSTMDVELDLDGGKRDVNDMFESIKEHLEIEETFKDTSLKELIDLNEDHLKRVFVMVSQDLDTELICKFGNGVSRSNFGYIRIIEAFIKYILISKLFLEYNAQTYSLFVNFLNNHSNVVCREFSCKFQEIPNCTKSIIENLIGLNSTHKQSLLREFILTTEKLEENQFQIVDCLISNQIDNESLQKLIELLVAVSGVFNNDKMFGKLVLNVISNCKGQIRPFEQQLVHITNLHRSVWKNKLNKALDECVQCNSSLSQTTRY